MTFDRDALMSASNGVRSVPSKGKCSTCDRAMHKTPLIVGEATEWRHDSTGHAVSWNPARHNAGLSKVGQHGHRWSEADEEGVKRCTFGSCDSETLVRVSTPVHRNRTETEEHVAESRRRGGQMRREQTRRRGSGKVA